MTLGASACRREAERRFRRASAALTDDRAAVAAAAVATGAPQPKKESIPDEAPGNAGPAVA